MSGETLGRRCRLTAAAGIVLLWMSTGVVAGQPQARTVLTIHLGAESFPTNPVIDAAIREALLARATMPIDYFAEYLDEGAVSANEVADALADYIRRKYRGRRIDVVIAITDQSLRFALDRRSDLFPDAPIVSLGLGIVDAQGRRAGPGVTGVIVGTSYARTIDVALRLHPATERVYVIANGPDRPTVELARGELRDVSQRVPLVYLEETSVPRLVAAVKNVPPRSLVVYIWDTTPDPGNLLYPDAIARTIAEASPVPVYGVSDFYIGKGIVGGVMRRTNETAARLGDMAARILNGERADDIPVETARVVPVFDWRQTRRWNIDPSKLPPGSDVQFRTPTLWESYRPYIVGVFIVVSAQLALIAGLLTQRARRRRAEATIRAREATLRSSYERIRQLAGRLIHAQETARAGIARDLHDGVCQDLAGVSVSLATLKNAPGRLQDTDTQEALAQIEHETIEAYDAIRRMSHELHPATLQLLGLATTLRTHCVEIGKRQGVRVTFKVDGDLGQLDRDAALCLFRIAQESLRNAIVHGKAGRLEVSLARSNDRVELTVTDDGLGFDVDDMRCHGHGLGLLSMEERAHLFGGDVRIVSSPRHGTSVHVRLPTRESRARAVPGTA
jgi:signal transduction histidine kinase